MNRDSILFYSILTLAFVGVGTLFFPVYAEDPKPWENRIVTGEQIESLVYKFDTAKSTLIENYNTGVGKFTSNPERIIDYTDANGKPVYVDKRIFEDANTIQYETEHGSVILDKNTCGFSFFNKGYITEGETPLFTDSIIARIATNGTDDWNPVNQINNAVCSASFNDSEITASKSHAVGLMEYKYINTGNSWKTQLEATNLNNSTTNKKFGFTQTIDLNRDTIHYGGAQRNLDNFNGTTFDRTWLENNEGKVINLLNGHSFDFDLGFDQLWAVTVEDTGADSSKLSFDYTRNSQVLLPQNTVIVDPTFAPSLSSDQYVRDTDNSGTCDDTGATYTLTDNTQLYSGVEDSPSSGDCYRFYTEFDTSAWSAGTATSADLVGDVNIVYNAETHYTHIMDTAQPSTRTASQVFDEIDDDPQCSSDSISGTGGITISLDSCLTEITTQLESGAGWLAFGVKSSEGAQTGSHQGAQFDGHSGGTPFTLSIEYDVPTQLTNKPTTITSEGLPFAINGSWSGCETDDCSEVTGFTIWNTTAHLFADLPLPIESGNDEGYSSLTGSVSMANTDIHYPFDDRSGESVPSETITQSSCFNVINIQGGGSQDFLGLKVVSGSALEGLEVDSIKIYAYQNGGPSGDADIVVYNDAHTEQHDFGSVDVTTLTTSSSCGSATEITGSDGSYTLQADDRIGIRYDVAGAGDVRVWKQNTDVYDSTNTILSEWDTTGGGAWGDFSSEDLKFEIITVDGTIVLYTAEDMHTATLANKNNATRIDGESITFIDGPIDLAVGSVNFPLNFTSTDGLIEGTNDFHLSAFVNKSSASQDFTILAFEETGAEYTHIGMDENKIYVKTDNSTTIASVDNNCNVNSLCHIAIDRNGSTFTFFVNGTSLGTNSSSTDLGTAINDQFFIGGNSTGDAGDLTLYNELKFYLQFEEASGSLSNNCHDTIATDCDAETSFTTDVNAYSQTGIIGSAVDIASTGDEIDIASHGITGTGSYTVNAWVDDTNAGSDDDYLMSFGTTGSADKFLVYFHFTTGNFNCHFRDGASAGVTSNTAVSASYADSDLDMYTCIIDRTDNEMRTYLNGVLQDTDDISGITGDVTPIGNSVLMNFANGGSNGLNQDVDEFGLWFEEKTQAHITALYNSGSGLDLQTGGAGFDTSAGIIDEFFVKDTSEDQTANISARGFNDPVWVENIAVNQTFAYIDDLNIGETTYYRPQLSNSLGNSTIYGPLLYATVDSNATAPSLTANEASASQIDLISTAGASNGGDVVKDYGLRCELNGAGGWLDTVSNSTLPANRSYNYTGLTSGDSLICQWRDGNGVGWSEWSGNATGTTHEGTTGTVSVSSANVGDILNTTSNVSITTGSPSPITLDRYWIYENGTIVKTVTISESVAKGANIDLNPVYYQITDDDPHEYFIQIRASNTTGTVLLNSTTFDYTREYDPDYFTAEVASEGTVNYTLNRHTSDTILDLKVNRDKGGDTWQIECLYQNPVQAIQGPDGGGTWSNGSSVGYWYDSQTVTAGTTTYISCYNENLLFTTTAYGNITNFLSAGLTIFEDYGGLFGAPSAMLIVLAIFSLATGRNAPTILVIGLAVTGILGSIGMLAFDGAIWGLLMVLGALGIFGIKRFF